MNVSILHKVIKTPAPFIFIRGLFLALKWCDSLTCTLAWIKLIWKVQENDGVMLTRANKPVSIVVFFNPLHPSSSLKVPAVSQPSSQRMTPRPTTPVTQTAAAARVMTLTRRHFCWMSHWRGQPAPLMPTVQPKHLALCSGPLETLPVKEPQAVLPLAPPHQLVSVCHFLYHNKKTTQS